MADPKPEQPHQHMSIQIDAPNANGVYSNLMMISHRKEEFILDFLFVQPQRTPRDRVSPTCARGSSPPRST